MNKYAVESGVTREMLERSLLSKGNLARLARVFRKALNGEKILIGMIGGSLTQGAHASDYLKNSYTALVRDWWVENFPNAEIEYHNAGVGGTQSILGVHRVDGHILQYAPDFVIVEFAVNDHADEWQTEAYANLVRRILSYPTAPAVMMLFNMGQSCDNVQHAEIPVGKHYDLAMISQRDALADEIKSGRIIWEDIAVDYVHPNDRGHMIIASLICDYLDTVLKNLDSITDQEMPLPEPMFSEKYMEARIFDYDHITPVSLGGSTYRYAEEEFWLTYRKYWRLEAGAEPLVFEVEGSRLLILYEGGSTDKHKISVSVDGEEKRRIEKTTLDAGSAAIYTAYDGEEGKHTLAIYCDEGVFEIKAIMAS